MTQRVPNYEIDNKLEQFLQEFIEFKNQYETDMRGDKKLANGDMGVIGEIRAIKKRLNEYPSLPWLLSHRPKSTIGAIMIGFAILQVMWTAGIFWIVTKFLV